MSKNILCLLGFHKWTNNKNGCRICKRCHKIDQYFGATGMLRRAGHINRLTNDEIEGLFPDVYGESND